MRDRGDRGDSSKAEIATGRIAVQGRPALSRHESGQSQQWGAKHASLYSADPGPLS
jgi:hypothetical protein